MAEDDNFDIDIYGDGGGYNTNEQGDMRQEEQELILDAQDHNQNGAAHMDGSAEQNPATESSGQNGEHVTSTDTGQQPQNQLSNPQQGVKRKEHDDRPTDPDAMTALLISDLYWWTTDDDIRGWVNEAQCEDEIKDVTFSEHKVNGKSKGQAFLEFTSLQASTATKHRIESLNETGEGGRRYMVTYTAPYPNPFRTLPKDAPMRKDHQGRGGFHSPSQSMNFGMNNMGTGFRGGRGGFHNRGAMTGNMGGFGGNRPFPNQMGGGFQGSPMAGSSGGFQGNTMGMQNMQGGFGFNNRGNMMGGMRGGMRGRGGGGGMQGPNVMGMPGMGPMGGMGGMGMNPMSGGMNPMMGGMGGNMGMQGGFQGPNQGYNQGFFPGGDGSWNPHGAKRSRQE